MGQEWIIVNLDRREYRYIGKFGEDWFDDEEKSLTRVLSRPLVKAKLEFNPRQCLPEGSKVV
ncbi:hypothetical protein OF83DRAFT_1180727 [Amylostereum chailletii]|nr:hypothetical protein OF83DRAFT_1180727 [Amylostereum chailletii]